MSIKARIARRMFQIIPLLLDQLETKEAKAAIDKMLDVIEDKIARSKTKIDDYTIQPLINLLRRIGDIPDNDD